MKISEYPTWGVCACISVCVCACVRACVRVYVSVRAYISISYGMCIFGSGQEILVPFSAKVCFKGYGCHGN